MTDVSLTEELLTEFGFLKKAKCKLLAKEYADNFQNMPEDKKNYVKTNAPDFYAALLSRFYREHYNDYSIPLEDAKFIDANLQNYWATYLLNRVESNFPTSILSIRPFDIKYLATSSDDKIKTRFFVTLHNILQHNPETILAKSPDDTNFTIAQKRLLNDFAAKDKGGQNYNDRVNYQRSRGHFEIDPRYDMSKIGKAPPAKATVPSQPVAAQTAQPIPAPGGLVKGKKKNPAPLQGGQPTTVTQPTPPVTPVTPIPAPGGLVKGKKKTSVPPPSAVQPTVQPTPTAQPTVAAPTSNNAANGASAAPPLWTDRFIRSPEQEAENKRAIQQWEDARAKARRATETPSPATPSPVQPNEFSATNKTKIIADNMAANEPLAHKIYDETESDPDNFFSGTPKSQLVAKNIAQKLATHLQKYHGFLEYYDKWLYDGTKKTEAQMERMRIHMDFLVQKWMQ